jgi:hypothetical protein
MSAAEWLTPDESTAQDLPAEDLTWLRRDWAPRVSAWLLALSSARPEDGSENERVLLAHLLGLLAEPARRVRVTPWLDGLQRGLARGLNEVVRNELDSTETERKLVLRHLEKSVDQLVIWLEWWQSVIQDAWPDAHAMRIEEALRDVSLETVTFSTDDRIVLRLLLDVAVALDLLKGPVKDLAWWAHHSLASARRVAALMARGVPHGLRGELARLRARHAWDEWTEEDLAKEFHPWSQAPPRG